MGQTYLGTVLSFSPSRGYGFIVPDKPPTKQIKDLFFHCSEIEGSRSDIAMDTRVQFEIHEGNDGRALAKKVVPQ